MFICKMKEKMRLKALFSHIFKKVIVGVAVLGGALLLMGASTGAESQAQPSPETFPSKVVWTSDGKHIIFSRGYQGMSMVDVAGSELQTIPKGVLLGTASPPGHALPALTPDGTRLAFVAQLGGLVQSTSIMVSALDGTGARRLTRDEKFNSHPAWSPDGQLIAYIADGELAVMSADGLRARVLAPSVEVVDAAPVWSPHGSRIAFVGIQDHPVHHYAVYTVRPDGTELTNLGATVSVPSWSPNDSRIAFLMPGDRSPWALVGEVSIYTLDILRNDLLEVWPLDVASIWADNLSWSPDGSAILFASSHGEVVVVSLDIRAEEVFSVSSSLFDNRSRTAGSAGPSAASIPTREYPGDVLIRTAGRWAAWAPDGSRIAILMGLNGSGENNTIQLEIVSTVSRIGLLKRTLIQSDGESLIANYPGWYDVQSNVAACSEGYVVPDPGENAALVRDCETLMVVRDKLAGDFLLNWSADTPITDWWGVEIREDKPSRVEALELSGINWMYRSYAVRYLVLFSAIVGLPVDYNGPALTGFIPPELGKLTGLRTLSLSYNRLRGGIPAELGELMGLQHLDLANSGVTGSVPAELGDILFLDTLYLSSNSLSGSIPPELGKLRLLRDLSFVKSGLTGCVPRTLTRSYQYVAWDFGDLEYCAE